MPACTVLLDFSVDPGLGMDNVRNDLENELLPYFRELLCLCNSELSDGGQVFLYSGPNTVLITVRIFKKGLLTLNIEYFHEEDVQPLLSYQQVEDIESSISVKLTAKRSKALPAVKRGASFDVYLNSSDERIIEYDFDELLFQEISPYQNVQVAHSKTLGNMLILDGLQNLSERDGVYTETLMFKNIENFEDKEIVILGGGDGALLNALLKEHPKYVWMLELDDVVIKASSQYLRSCCGSVLDTRKADGYEIVTGDCIESLGGMIRENRLCDYVFGDLTDSPIQVHHKREDAWNFLELIIRLSFQVLKPSGKFITHCCGVTNEQVLTEFENLLRKIEPSVKFSKATAFVPSFMEDWVFYSVWR